MKRVANILCSLVMFVVLALPGSAALALPRGSLPFSNIVQSPPAIVACSGLPIAFGQTRGGSLSNSNSQTFYCFSGSTAQDVTIEMGAISGSSIDTIITLYAPNGQQIGFNDDISSNNYNSRLTVRLPQGGDYTIKASRYGSTSGYYSISLNASSGSGGGGGGGAVGTLPCDGGDGVYLFEHPGYGGRCDKFQSDSPNPRSWSVGNDSASAIKIIGNWTATICQHDDFGGTCVPFTQSNGNLTSIGDGHGGTIADQASSIRVSRTGNSGGGGGSGNSDPQGCIRAPVDVNETYNPGCQCVDWIIRRYNLCRFSGYGNAEDLDRPHSELGGPWMARNGFHQVQEPQAGDVVVMQSSRMNNVGGHIAFVNSNVFSDSAGRYIWIVGANQQNSNPRVENGCGDVSDLKFYIDRGGTTFWRR